MQLGGRLPCQVRVLEELFYGGSLKRVELKAQLQRVEQVVVSATRELDHCVWFRDGSELLPIVGYVLEGCTGVHQII